MPDAIRQGAEMTWITLIVTCLLPATLAAQSAAPAETCTRDESAVADVVRRLIRADNARDLPAVLDVYSDDVMFLPPSGEIVDGKPAVERRYRALFSTYRVRLETTIEEVRADADLAFVRGVNTGTLEPVAGGSATAVNDRYLAILECRSGRWRVTRLVWNKVAVSRQEP